MIRQIQLIFANTLVSLLLGLGLTANAAAESVIASLDLPNRTPTRCERQYDNILQADTVINTCREELTLKLEDYDRIAVLETLGKVYLSQKEVELAINSWREASQYVPPTRENLQHIEIWARLQLLIGQTYGQQGQREMAEKQFEATLATVESLIGKYSLPAGMVQDAIGTSLALAGNGPSALEAFNRSRIVHEIRLGKLHPRTIETRLNYAVGLLDLGREDDARNALVVLSEVIAQDTSFQSRPLRAEVLTFLGTLQMRNNEILEAAENYQTAFEIRASAYGPEDVRTSQSLNNLGVVLYRAGDLKRAEVALSRAYIIRRDKLGVNDPLTISSQKNLQAVLEAQKSKANG